MRVGNQGGRQLRAYSDTHIFLNWLFWACIGRSVLVQLYDEGMALFTLGQLRPAYDKFEAALAKAPVKTKVSAPQCLCTFTFVYSVARSVRNSFRTLCC